MNEKEALEIVLDIKQWVIAAKECLESFPVDAMFVLTGAIDDSGLLSKHDREEIDWAKDKLDAWHLTRLKLISKVNAS